MCVCGSIQTQQDSAGQTLTVDLQCSCAFSKSVNCTQTECSPETPPTVERKATRSSMVMPTTTTSILTTTSKEIATCKKGKTSDSEMVSPTPITTEHNNISGMQGCNCNYDITLGAFVDLLIAIVIILMIRWTCTCLIMKRVQVNHSKR